MAPKPLIPNPARSTAPWLSHVRSYIIHVLAAMDSDTFKERLTLAIASYSPLPKKLNYGTAGFRDRYDLPLDIVFFKMGILAYLRSCSVRGQPLVGVMITASHNAEIDNGIKIVDPSGGMLDQTWEPLAEAFVNASSLQDLFAAVDNIVMLCQELNSSGDSEAPFMKSASVIIGRDCRPHSSTLADCTCAGVRLCGGLALNLGEVTTPQLHFTVQSMNKRSLKTLEEGGRAEALQHYYDSLSQGYIDLSMTAGKRNSNLDAIVVDGARGIGAIALAEMNTLSFSKKCPTMICVDIRNEVGSGPVNDGCGAELVQKGQVPPEGVGSDADEGKMLCSFDGDADRIVFHSFLPKWTLFDGDKISVLFALLISQEMDAAGLLGKFSLGVVQTAYANGSSAHFFRSKSIPTVMARTGVKFLHHKALDYDVGIYFEANGHGTVLFSERFLEHISQLSQINGVSDKGAGDALTSSSSMAIRRLHAVTRVINQAVGDAISDMLFVLAALRVLDLDLYSWDRLYSDLPSKQVKMAVSATQKAQIVCSEDESFVVSPAELQRGLQEAMQRVPMGRVFVRPSGTEDVVRVYAEATSAEGADELVETARRLISSVLK